MHLVTVYLLKTFCLLFWLVSVESLIPALLLCKASQAKASVNRKVGL